MFLLTPRGDGVPTQPYRYTANVNRHPHTGARKIVPKKASVLELFNKDKVNFCNFSCATDDSINIALLRDGLKGG